MLQSMGSQSQTWLSNWTKNTLLASYPEISLLCWIYFEHGGNYLEGISGAQEANRHFTVAFFTWGPPNIWQTFPLTCLWSLVLQRGAKLLGAAHHHTASRLWNPCRIVMLFLPLESPSSLSVSSPMGFHVPFLYCLSLLQKRCFFFLFKFPHMSVVENEGAFVKCTVLHSPCSSLFDDLILRGKRDSEEENLLSALNPGFWPFFAKTVSCRLFSDPNLPVLRTRNKSLHKNPRVCFQVFEGKFWSPVELFGGVCYFTRDRAECLWFTLLLRSLFYVLLWFSDFSWFGFGKVKSRQGVGK